MEREKLVKQICAMDRSGQLAFTYPEELHALEKAGASADDIARILTGRATVNEIQSKLQLAPLPWDVAKQPFLQDPTAVIRDFPGPVFSEVREYWRTRESEHTQRFWEQTKNERVKSAGFMLESGIIDHDVFDFLTGN